MPKGPREEYNKMEFERPKSIDLEVYDQLQQLVHQGSETVQNLKTKPQYLALRADKNVPPIAAIIGGFPEYIGVYHPSTQTPELYIKNKDRKPVIEIGEPGEVRRVEVLPLDSNDSTGNRWSDVAAHPNDYDWPKLIA